MELSIILSVYNMSEDERLEKCLNSLLEQTISDYEIIVVDDASTDGTEESLFDFAANYPDAFQILHAKEHIGSGGARNLALQKAKGKWIAFMEVGDLAVPDMYEKLLEKAKATQADVAACDYVRADGTVVHTHTLEQAGELDEAKYKALLLDFGTLCTKIYKRKLLQNCGMEFPQYLHCDDKAMECAILLHTTSFAYVPEALYIEGSYEEIHEVLEEENTSELVAYCEHYTQAGKRMIEYAEEHGYLEAYGEELEYKFIELYYMLPFMTALEYGAPKEYLRSLIRQIKIVVPKFEKNRYYRESIGKEQHILMHLHTRSTYLMLAYRSMRQAFSKLQNGNWKRDIWKAAGMTMGAFLCLLFIWQVLLQKQSEAYSVVLLGDSIVANAYYGASIDEMLSEALGETVFNGGFGGSYLCGHNAEAYETMGDESLSLEFLTDSIITGDFLVQKSVIQKISKLDYFEERLKALSQIDFDQTQILILEHGVNDYLLQIEPKQVGETLQKVLSRLSDRYPKMQIFVSSPTYCFIEHDGETWYCDTTDLGQYPLEAYVQAQEQVCEELGIPFIDNYHQNVITRETVESYVIDGLHLNEAGRQVVAERIATAINDVMAK